MTIDDFMSDLQHVDVFIRLDEYPSDRSISNLFIYLFRTIDQISFFIDA